MTITESECKPQDILLSYIFSISLLNGNCSIRYLYISLYNDIKNNINTLKIIKANTEFYNPKTTIILIQVKEENSTVYEAYLYK